MKPKSETNFPPDPPVLPEAILALRPHYEKHGKAGWKSLFETFDRAVLSKDKARDLNFRKSMQGMLGESRDLLPTGKPTSIHPLFSMICALDFDWDRESSLYALKDGIRKRGWQFLEDLVALNKRLTKVWGAQRGVVPYRREPVFLIRNWIRYHDLDFSLPGLCWFTLKGQFEALKRFMGKDWKGYRQNLIRLKGSLELEPAKELIESIDIIEGRPLGIVWTNPAFYDLF